MSRPPLAAAAVIVVLLGTLLGVPAPGRSAPAGDNGTDVSVTGRLRVLPAEGSGATDRRFLETPAGTVALVGAQPGSLARATPNSRVQVEGLLRPAQPTDELVVRAATVVRAAPAQPFGGAGVVAEPVWHDVHVAGMNQPGTSGSVVTREMVEQIIAEVDEYYDRSTDGRHRFRLAEWVPFGDEIPGAVCSSFVGEMGVLDTLVHPDDRTDLRIGLSDGDCQYTVGQGWIGAPGVMIYDYLHSDAWAHEIGHNLGLDHSGQADCAGDVLSACADVLTDDSLEPYGGDDIMGYALFRPATSRPTLNPINRVVLGAWPDAAEVSLDQAPAQPQEYTLADVDAATGVRALRLRSGNTDLRIVGRAAAGGMTVRVFQRAVDDYYRTVHSINQLPAPLAGQTTYGGDLGFRLRILAVTPDSATVRIRSDAPVPIPDPPSGVTAVADDGSATVSWLPVAGALSYSVSNSQSADRCTVTAPATSCRLTGLTNGVAHTFTVSVTTEDGTSVPSPPTGAVVPRCVTTVSLAENPATNLLAVTVTPAATRSVTVRRWTATGWQPVRTVTTSPGGRALAIPRTAGMLQAVAAESPTCAPGDSAYVIVAPLAAQRLAVPAVTTPLYRTYPAARNWLRDSRAALPRTTLAGRSVTYRSLDPTCSVVATVFGPRVKGWRTGACRIRATAVGGWGVATLSTLITRQIARR